MSSNQLRITGALLFSLLAHGLLLGLATNSGTGQKLAAATRKTVVMRLAARPRPPAPVVKPRTQPVSPPSVPQPQPVAPTRPRPSVAPVAVMVREIPTPVVPEPTSPVKEMPVEPAAAPSEAASPTPSALPAGDETAGGEEGLVLATPLYRQNPPPAYPARARRLGWQGTVVLEVLVGETGQVLELAVRDSSGHRLLDEAALQAVRNWRFTPGRQGSLPPAMKVLVPVRFGLE